MKKIEPHLHTTYSLQNVNNLTSRARPSLLIGYYTTKLLSNLMGVKKILLETEHH